MSLYDFIDVNQQQGSAGIPTEGVYINGISLDTDISAFRTLAVSGRESIEAEILEVETETLDGNIYHGKRYEPRTLTVQFQLLCKTQAEMNAAVDRLNYLLGDEELKVSFADLPDRYYIGNKTRINAFEPGRLNVVGSFEIYCSDPFAYSEEEGTYSALHYDDDVPEEVKQQRLDKLMRIQQRISGELEAEKVGKTYEVIIDRKEGDYYVGRTEFCSPEVDPEVLIPVAERELTIGEFYEVRMTDSEEFDLYGTTINV